MKSFAFFSLCFTMLFFSVIMTTSEARSQDKSGKVAIGIPVQVTSLDFILKFWANDNVAIEPIVGYNHIATSNNSGDNWRLGLGFTCNWGDNNFIKYVGMRGAWSTLSAGNKSYTDGGFGGVFGLEYFAFEHLSFAGELQLNVLYADKDFSPLGLVAGTTNVNTGEILFARFYF